MADNPATVTVPRELLREVIDVLERWDLRIIQDTMNDGDGDVLITRVPEDEVCQTRARIAELRRIAGLEDANHE